MNINKFLFCLLLLTFTFSCASNSTKKEIKTKVDQLYMEKINLETVTSNSKIFSKDILERINKVNTFTKNDIERIKISNSPTDKPFLLEGSLITSLYEGFSTYNIKKIQVKNETAEATVDLQYDSDPKQIWEDKIILKKENGWRIDNIIY